MYNFILHSPVPGAEAMAGAGLCIELPGDVPVPALTLPSVRKAVKTLRSGRSVKIRSTWPDAVTTVAKQITQAAILDGILDLGCLGDWA